MTHADERTFRPGKLADSDRLRLMHAISSQPDGVLALCRSLRSLADEAEALFEHDKIADHLRLAVAASILADLGEQEWRVVVRDLDILVAPPDWSTVSGHTASQIKSRVRNGLQIASDRQIASDNVQSFLRSIERKRVFGSKVVSIASLIDDGEDLFRKLRPIGTLDASERTRALRKVIDPYLQVCEDREFCEHTGLPLLDVWRYFRHTWSLEYNPLPGRTLRFLVRNGARSNHPIIGIAMVASPATNMYIRDHWVGWRLEDLIAGLRSGSLDAKLVGQSLWTTIQDAISEIRSDDLVLRKELKNPTEETFFKLRQIAGLAQRQRRGDLSDLAEGRDVEEKVVDIRTFGKRKLRRKDWRILSETPLFVKKRAEQLVPLLRAYEYMKGADFDAVPAAAVYESLVHRRGRAVMTFALNELRKRKIATEVVDLSVCGAVAPYNQLLGGKLVTLLMGSEDVRRMYAERYGARESEIASQMAGRPIVRSSTLCVMTTTSLYGVSSSQYNRLKVSVRERKSSPARQVEWEYLGHTEGVTVTHVSKRTVHLMKALGSSVYKAARVNSVFGEGSSPRTRQIREGLNLIGINNDSVLMQSIGRRVYACELFPGARDAMTGFKPTKGHPKGVSARALASAWIERWLANRILNIDALEELRQQGAEAISRSFRERALRGALESDETDGQGSLPLASVSSI